MTNLEFIKNTNLENTFIIGYYGGGNFGDELLLEVLQNLLYKKKTKKLKFYYTDFKNYSEFHENYGYTKVDPANKLNFLKQLITSDNIIIGGGGIWGLDFNFKVFVLSILLFVLRFLFHKKVNLLGIGYYSSTTKLGHISAYIAGKAANTIITRDNESNANFSKINPKNTYQDWDLSFNIPFTDKADFESEISKLEAIISPQTKTIIIAIRRFADKYKNNCTTIVEELIKNNPKQKFVLNIFEPKRVDPEGYELISKLKDQYNNIQAIFDFDYNPLVYYYFLKKHHKNIITIAPQFHSIITSYQAGVSFYPVVYDNKVEELMGQLNIKNYKWIKNTTKNDLQKFIDNELQKHK